MINPENPNTSTTLNARAMENLPNPGGDMHAPMYVQLLGDPRNRSDAKLVLSADLLEKLHLCSPIQRVPPLRLSPKSRVLVCLGGGPDYTSELGQFRIPESQSSEGEIDNSEEGDTGQGEGCVRGNQHSLVEIDDVLNRLAGINPRLRRVVELRVFEGLTREEIAREMGCGTATVARHWSFARNWLEEAFAGTPGL